MVSVIRPEWRTVPIRMNGRGARPTKFRRIDIGKEADSYWAGRIR